MTPGYKAPAQKSLAEIASQDADDESLRRYKEALLGNFQGDPNETRRVVLLKLSVVVDGREDICLDLSGDLSKFKENPIVMKEGTSYKVKIDFRTPNEIVSGLRLMTKVYRKGIVVDKQNHMVGSYGPKPEPHEFFTPAEEAPSGMIARGKYTCKSRFIDDDKNVYLEWEWVLDIKKDWK